MVCLTGRTKHNDRGKEVYEGGDFEAVNFAFTLKNILMQEVDEMGAWGKRGKTDRE